MKDALILQNPHWNNKEYEQGVERSIFKQLKKALEEKFIKVIIGPRRAGKSFLTKQLINHLIKKEIKKENILYINFEDPQLINLKTNPNNIEKIYNEYLELKNPKGTKYLFLDEIQNIEQWEQWVRTTYDLKQNIQLIITGSNSQLLSSELATKLTGRTITFTILPFSFKEYLIFKKIDHKGNYERLLSRKNEFNHYLEQFILEGGFPEIIRTKNKELQTQILKDYFQSIIYKDIIPRFKIRNTKVIEQLAYHLITNITSQYSYNKLAKLLGTNENTIKEFTNLFEKAFLLFEIEKNSFSTKKQIINNKKTYCIDQGLRNAIALKFSEDKGKIIENMVCIELIRRGEKPTYYLEKNEIDFITKKEAIQVTYTDKILERELKAFENIIKKEKIILTKNTFEKGKIKKIPLWYWLINN